MEKKWTVSGAFADWTLTVSTAPTSKYHEPDLPDWQQYNFARLADHFYDLVCMCEHLQDFDEGEVMASALCWYGPKRSPECGLGDGSPKPSMQIAQAGPVGTHLDHP